MADLRDIIVIFLKMTYALALGMLMSTLLQAFPKKSEQVFEWVSYIITGVVYSCLPCIFFFLIDDMHFRTLQQFLARNGFTVIIMENLVGAVGRILVVHQIGVSGDIGFGLAFIIALSFVAIYGDKQQRQHVSCKISVAFSAAYSEVFILGKKKELWPLGTVIIFCLFIVLLPWDILYRPNDRPNEVELLEVDGVNVAEERDE